MGIPGTTRASWVWKRWASGVSFQTSYTFSRNIDTTQASTFFSDGTNGTTTAFPEFDQVSQLQQGTRGLSRQTTG